MSLGNKQVHARILRWAPHIHASEMLLNVRTHQILPTVNCEQWLHLKVSCDFPVSRCGVLVWEYKNNPLTASDSCKEVDRESRS